MNKNDKIYIAGHRGMVGSAIRKKLEEEGFRNLVYKTSGGTGSSEPVGGAFFF